MNLEKQKAFIIYIIYIAMILGLGYIVIKYLLPMLMPFVIGLVIAVVFRKLIDFIEAKLHIKRAFISIFILIVFYGLLVLMFSFIGVKIFTFLRDLFGRLPTLYEQTIQPAISKLADDLVQQFPQIKPYIENLNDTIFGFVTSASSSVIGMITGIAGALPMLLIKLIFMVVSSFFFTIDYYRITNFVIRQFKGERRAMVLKLKDNGIGTLGKFFRAYATIISITFVELSVGFWIIGIPNAPLYGALIAVIDVLPILGTGAVLVPWSVIAFILGTNRIGFGMLILYIIITAVRQAIEPKIVGQQIGLHPILTLLLMYVGTQLMGVLGLLLLPVIATILKKLNDEGTIQLFH